MSDIKFVKGLHPKAPHENAPSFVKAKLNLKRQDLIDWLLSQQGEWIAVDVKESKGGKWYAAVDDWEPNSAGGTTGNRSAQPPADNGGGSFDSDIPFMKVDGRVY